MHAHSISLPSPAPSDPLPLVEQWLDDARAGGWRNPNAMALATSDARGLPAVRMVLLKRFAAREGYTVFFTHYGSRKARELQNGHAAAVLYWAELGRQVRFEGVVVRSPAAESDAYFATRPLRSQLNAWSSEQSNVLTDPAELTMRAAHKAREHGWDADQLPPEGARPLPRPAFWGGYRLWLDALELWVEGADRFHERVRYTRALLPVDAHTFHGGDWTHQRLQP